MQLVEKKTFMMQLEDTYKTITNVIIKLFGVKAESYIKKREKAIEISFFKTIKLNKIVNKYPIYYSCKLVFTLMAVIIGFSIFYTNLNIKKLSLISNFTVNGTSISGMSMFGITEDEFRTLQNKESNIMNLVFQNIDSNYYQLTEDKKLSYLSSIVEDIGGVSREDILTTAQRAYYKISELNKMKNNKYSILVMIIFASIIGWLTPNFLLYLWGRIVAEKIKNETDTLQNITILVGDNPNTTVIEILQTLKETSTIHDEYFEKAYFQYLISADKGIEILNGASDKEVKKIAIALLQAQTYEKTKAIDNLRKYIERKQKKLRDTEDFQIKAKENIALVILIIPIFIYIALIMYPLLKVFTDFS